MTPQAPTTTLETTHGNGARKAMPTAVQVAERTAHYDEESRTAIQRFHRIILEQKWTLEQAGLQVVHGSKNGTISPAILSQLINGKYVSPSAACKSIARAVYLINERALNEETGHIHTRLSKTIFAFCQFAATNRKIVRIYGKTQDGKTTALKYFAGAYKGGQPLYIRLPASASYLLAAKSIARALGDFASKSNEAVRNTIFSTVTSSHTIILDEGHLPFTTYGPGHAKRFIELVREIHDVCGCGIVFCGTESLRENIMTGGDSLLFKQLVQRSPTCLDTTRPRTDDDRKKDLRPGFGAGGKDDLLKIVQFFGLPIPDDDTFKSLKRVISTDSTGRLFQFLSGAQNKAKTEGVAITWDHFTATIDQLNKYSS